MGRELNKPIPSFREQEGNEKIHSHNSGTGRKWKKTFPKFGNRKGMKKKTFPKLGKGKGMKKSIPIIREWESEAFILGNGREREFPLTPDSNQLKCRAYKVATRRPKGNLSWSCHLRFYGSTFQWSDCSDMFSQNHGGLMICSDSFLELWGFMASL